MSRAKRAPKPEPIEKPSSEPLAIVVRRGALKRFDQMKKKTADLPVEVLWDRRLGDRRGPTADIEGDRRRAERRQQPPFTWSLADFVVVTPPDEDSSR